MKNNILIIQAVIILFLSNFSYSQDWVQQNVPLTTGYFNDMKFVNANTGFICNSTPLFLKTTNSGFNWQTVNNFNITSLAVIDSMYVYGAGHTAGYSKLYKSTDCGITWDSLLQNSPYFASIYFFNRDTGLISGYDGFNVFIGRTTNGGQSATQVYTINSSQFTKFFFLKEKVEGEYYGIIYFDDYWWKTTNSGLNWMQMPNLPDPRINSIFFLNKDTGWATLNVDRTYIYYTTNGGINWQNQNVPFNARAYDIYFANTRKGWIGCDAGNHKIYATINGGVIWGSQTLPGLGAGKLYFLDSITGWAQTSYNTLAHTTNGGGPVTQISNSLERVANVYILFQNYPNPFNPSTNIQYKIKNSGFVSLRVYDILGKEIAVLISEKQKSGLYELKFDGSDLSSGIYFYRLEIRDNNSNLIFNESKKMLKIE